MGYIHRIIYHSAVEQQTGKRMSTYRTLILLYPSHYEVLKKKKAVEKRRTIFMNGAETYSSHTGKIKLGRLGKTPRVSEILKKKKNLQLYHI